jgi:hypothetical protein
MDMAKIRGTPIVARKATGICAISADYEDVVARKHQSTGQGKSESADFKGQMQNDFQYLSFFVFLWFSGTLAGTSHVRVGFWEKIGSHAIYNLF